MTEAIVRSWNPQKKIKFEGRATPADVVEAAAMAQLNILQGPIAQ